MADSFQEDSFEEDAGSTKAPSFISRLQSNIPFAGTAEQIDARKRALGQSSMMQGVVKPALSDIADKVPWVLPGPKGLAMRSLQNAAVGTGQGLLKGQGLGQAVKEGGLVGAATAPIEGAFNVGRYFLSALPKTGAAALFSKGRTALLRQWLEENVPAWGQLKGKDATKWLYEAGHGSGQRVLSDEFEKQIAAVKNSVPADFKIKFQSGVTALPNGMTLPTTHEWNVRDLIDKLPELRKAGGELYRDSLDALEANLANVPLKDQSAADVLSAARHAYKVGRGFMDFAEHGKFLHGEAYDPARAMAALDTYMKKDLLSRQLDQVRQIVRGPGENPISAFKPSGLGYRFGAEAVGAGLGHTMGGVPGGAAGGVLGALVPRPQFYRNVPISGAAQQIRSAAPTGLTGPLRSTE